MVDANKRPETPQSVFILIPTLQALRALINGPKAGVRSPHNE